MSIFSSEKTCTCSFCGKPHTSVIKLIAGPGIYICDECVIICSEILAKEIPEWPKHIRCPKDPIKVNYDLLTAMRDAGEVTELVFNARLAEAVCREFRPSPEATSNTKHRKASGKGKA